MAEIKFSDEEKKQVQRMVEAMLHLLTTMTPAMAGVTVFNVHKEMLRMAFPKEQKDMAIVAVNEHAKAIINEIEVEDFFYNLKEDLNGGNS